MPTDHPIAQFLVKPVPGWTVSVKTVTLAKPIVTDDGSFATAVSEVTWTGGKILPGQYQDFSVSADPLPSGISQLVFKAVQTYSNGDVVRWIDLPQAGPARAGAPGAGPHPDPGRGGADGRGRRPRPTRPRPAGRTRPRSRSARPAWPPGCSAWPRAGRRGCGSAGAAGSAGDDGAPARLAAAGLAAIAGLPGGGRRARGRLLVVLAAVRLARPRRRTRRRRARCRRRVPCRRPARRPPCSCTRRSRPPSPPTAAS